MNHTESKHRLPWNKDEDEALLYLKEDLKIEKWTDIAEKLGSLYQIHNRNHQQCRDRYVNFLKNHTENKKWPVQNFNQLIELYLRYGNKWSEIANHFQNINGLLIKNKFYSRMRKGIRNINYLINSFLNESWQKFSFNITFKMINCAANKFDYPQKSCLGKKIQKHISFVEEIIKGVFSISWLDKRELRKCYKSKKQGVFTREKIQRLIEDINFIDENIDKKHSNRLIQKEKPINSRVIRRKRQLNNKGNSCDSDLKVQCDGLNNISGKYNSITHPFEKGQIQIVAVNSFDRNGQLTSSIDGMLPENSLMQKYKSLDQKFQQKNLPQKYSGYKQHKRKITDLQADHMGQQYFPDNANNIQASEIKMDGISDPKIVQD